MHEDIVVYIDVDDTLIRTEGGTRKPIAGTVALVKRLRGEGAQLFCWSAGGSEYAREVATELGIADAFTALLPKPEVIVDDMALPDWWLVEVSPEEIVDETDIQKMKEWLSRGGK